MASSSGRERIQSRGPRVFAFGSSTPRDFSHMNKVPPKLRNYDAKSVDKSDSPTLHDYIIKARSLSRDSPDNRSKFVFGSSTPRTLAHLDKIPTNQRVYDAKIPKKSATHSDFKAAPIRLPPPILKPTPKKVEETRHVITSKDDDIASEPDIVQDREEFMNELRKHKKSLEDKKKHETEPTKEHEHKQEHVKFSHAPEIVGNAQKSIRIRTETQEEAPVAVENLSANKMDDQLEVSQLHEIIQEPIASQPINTINSEKVVGNILAKIEGVVNDKIDEVAKVTNDVKETATKKIDSASESLKKVEKKIEVSANKIADNVVGKSEKVKENTKNLISNISGNITNNDDLKTKNIAETPNTSENIPSPVKNEDAKNHDAIVKGLENL